MNTSYKIKINFDFDENEYIVFVDEVPGLCGRGDTETAALLDFLNLYESEYVGFKCFNKTWVQNQISKLQLQEQYEQDTELPKS